MVSAAFKNVPQTTAKTFAFSSVFFFFYGRQGQDKNRLTKKCYRINPRNVNWLPTFSVPWTEGLRTSLCRIDSHRPLCAEENTYWRRLRMSPLLWDLYINYYGKCPNKHSRLLSWLTFCRPILALGLAQCTCVQRGGQLIFSTDFFFFVCFTL